MKNISVTEACKVLYNYCKTTDDDVIKEFKKFNISNSEWSNIDISDISLLIRYFFRAIVEKDIKNRKGKKNE